MPSEQLFSFLAWLIGSQYLAWRWGFYRSFPEREPLNITFGNVVGAFFIFLIFSAAIVPLLGAFVWFFKTGELIHSTAELSIEARAWLNLFGIMISGVALIVYALYLPKAIFKMPIFRNIGLGAITWFISFPFVVVIMLGVNEIFKWLGIPLPQEEQTAVRFLKMTQSDSLLFGSTVFLLVTVVPFIEELMFRGLLQSWLKKYVKGSYAILITSGIFSFFHFSTSQGLNNIELLLSLFVLACFLGYLFERQRSLWAPIGLHAAFNGMSIVGLLNVP